MLRNVHIINSREKLFGATLTEQLSRDGSHRNFWTWGGLILYTCKTIFLHYAILSVV